MPALAQSLFLTKGSLELPKSDSFRQKIQKQPLTLPGDTAPSAVTRAPLPPPPPRSLVQGCMRRRGAGVVSDEEPGFP